MAMKDQIETKDRKTIKELCSRYGTFAVADAMLEDMESELKDYHGEAVIQRDIVQMRKCVEEMTNNHFLRILYKKSQAKDSGKRERRKGRKEVIAEEIGCDIGDVEPYQPGRSRPQIYQYEGDYFVAIRGKEKLPDEQDYEWQHLKDNGTFKIYRAKA